VAVHGAAPVYQKGKHAVPVEKRPPAATPKDLMPGLHVEGPLFKDVDVHQIAHEFMDLPQDWSRHPELSHEFDTGSDLEPMRATHHGAFPVYGMPAHYYAGRPHHESYADGMFGEGFHHGPVNDQRKLDIEDQYAMYNQHQDYLHYYEPTHGPLGVWTDPYAHRHEEEQDGVDISKLQYEVLAQTPPAKPSKQSPKPSQQKKAPVKTQPVHK